MSDLPRMLRQPGRCTLDLRRSGTRLVKRTTIGQSRFPDLFGGGPPARARVRLGGQQRPREATDYAVRYGASVAGVALVTWLISLVLPRYHVGNISMIYLLL